MSKNELKKRVDGLEDKILPKKKKCQVRIDDRILGELNTYNHPSDEDLNISVIIEDNVQPEDDRNPE